MKVLMRVLPFVVVPVMFVLWWNSLMVITEVWLNAMEMMK